MLYLNKRKEGNFSFPPCEDQRCNICEEGRQLEIEELQCDDSLVTGCSPNEGMVNIRVSNRHDAYAQCNKLPDVRGISEAHAYAVQYIDLVS